MTGFKFADLRTKIKYILSSHFGSPNFAGRKTNIKFYDTSVYRHIEYPYTEVYRL
jgi:hypothetical protein